MLEDPSVSASTRKRKACVSSVYFKKNNSNIGFFAEILGNTE
jgi:hypothetical protein